MSLRLPSIGGRECVPVRLLPFLSGWQPLSPDVLARMFSQQHVFGPRHWWRKTTCRVDADEAAGFVELKPRDWDGIVDVLAALEARLQQDDTTPQELLRDEWNRRSVESIPPGVFVWREDLETEYVRMFGRTMVTQLQPDAPAMTDTDLEQVTSVDADEIEGVAALSMKRRGDGDLSFSPLLTDDDARVAFAGFEVLLAERGGNLTESPKVRMQRRLLRLRELGGDLRPAGDSFHLTGRRGALADLVREEGAAGRPMSKRQDVRRDLERASTAEQVQS